MKSETIRDKSTMSRKRSALDASAAQRVQHAGNPDEVPIPTKLIVKFAREVHIVPVDTIDYVESIKRKVFIHADSGVHQMYSTMRDVIARLPESFLRCHNSYLVNAERVASVTPTEVVLTSGTKVPMSKRYAKEVRKQLRASEE